MLKKSQPTEIKESLSPKPIGIWKISSSCSMHYMYLCEFKVCMNEMAGEPIGGLYVESKQLLSAVMHLLRHDNNGIICCRSDLAATWNALHLKRHTFVSVETWLV